MTTVGFVGATGLMGHGMAKNIARAGMSLRYTLRSESQRVEDLDGLGARQAPGIAALGRDCDVVVICVTSSADVEEVVDSLLEEPREGLVIVDSSTSEPTSTMKLSERARAQGVGYVDAPLTKGPAAAEAGDLNVMVGGAEADVARVLPVLEAFAGSVLRTGDVGTAHTLKLVNNTVIQAFCNALAEGFTVAGKAGLDPRLVHEILGRGGMNAPFLHAIAGALDGDHAGATAGLYRRASPYCQSLRPLGLDLPGAVQVAHSEEEIRQHAGHYEPLNHEGFARRVRNLRRDEPGWMIADEAWSLGGAQGKITVYRGSHGRFHSPKGSVTAASCRQPAAI